MMGSPMLGVSILEPLYVTLGTLVSWFYGFSGSFVVAIIMLTITVSILRMPLVNKQVKSQQAMQRVQPELKRIQAKYKDNPQKRNEELMKVYKENGVNPFAGCLPLLLQMPLFIVLYRLIMDLRKIPPKHIPEGGEMYRALVESGGKMVSFGMDLSRSAADVSNFADRLPYFFLIALVIGTGYYQQRQMTARMPAGSVNPQFQIIGKVFPVMLGVFSFSFPAAVVLYFVVSNIWQIGQQAFLFRHVKADATAGGGGGGKGGKPSAGRVGGGGKVIDAKASPTAKAGGQKAAAKDRNPAPAPGDDGVTAEGAADKPARKPAGRAVAKPAGKAVAKPAANGLAAWFSRRASGAAPARGRASANGKAARKPASSPPTKATGKPNPGTSGRVTPPGRSAQRSRSSRDRKGK